jgi:hypothetical protein
MPLQYRVIALVGYDISKLLEELMKQVTAKINTGATLVGGISITTLVSIDASGPKMLVSQALTYTVGQTNTIEQTSDPL